jgi:hypothetical protein
VFLYVYTHWYKTLFVIASNDKFNRLILHLHVFPSHEYIIAFEQYTKYTIILDYIKAYTVNASL